MHWAPHRYLQHTFSSTCMQPKEGRQFKHSIYWHNLPCKFWHCFVLIQMHLYKHLTRADSYQNKQHLVAFLRWQKKQVTSWTGCSPNVLTVSQDLLIYKEWRVCAPAGRIQACGPLRLRWNRANSSWPLHSSTYEWTAHPLGCYGYRSLNNKVKPALTKTQ